MLNVRVYGHFHLLGSMSRDLEGIRRGVYYHRPVRLGRAHTPREVESSSNVLNMREGASPRFEKSIIFILLKQAKDISRIFIKKGGMRAIFEVKRGLNFSTKAFNPNSAYNLSTCCILSTS